MIGYPKQCPPEQLITEEQTCKEAARELRNNYEGTAQDLQFPKGCVKKMLGGVVFNLKAGRSTYGYNPVCYKLTC